MLECLKKKWNNRHPENKQPAATPTTDYTPGPGAPEGWVEKALYVTGQFEGNGYGQISGNFDDQGMSCGILQHCLGQGSLQEKILKPFNERYKSPVFDELGLVDFLQVDIKTAVALGARRVKDANYRSKLRALLLTPEMISIQREAAQELGSKAWKLTKFSFPTHAQPLQFIAFLWFFDVLVQNGSLRGVKMPTENDVQKMWDHRAREFGKNRVIWMNVQHPHTAYRDLADVLLCWSINRAKKSHRQWRDDVVSRKGTIAMGVGTVHGDTHRDIHGLYHTPVEDLI